MLALVERMLNVGFTVIAHIVLVWLDSKETHSQDVPERKLSLLQKPPHVNLTPVVFLLLVEMSVGPQFAAVTLVISVHLRVANQNVQLMKIVPMTKHVFGKNVWIPALDLVGPMLNAELWTMLLFALVWKVIVATPLKVAMFLMVIMFILHPRKIKIFVKLID